MKCFPCVVFLFLWLVLLQTIDYGQTKAVSNPKNKKPDKIKENDLLEGDMIIDHTVWNIITNQTVAIKSKRSAVTNGVKLWPRRTVPYTINSQLGSSATKAISDAISDLNQQTCIKFVRRTYEYSYVEFIKGNGCYSYVGRTGGRQTISLGSGCEDKGVALHEIMHTLGFFHTSSRTDRDSYVIVYDNNVATGYLNNFRKYSHGQIDHLGSPYDITSIMHLPKDAFAKARGLYTIVARAGSNIILGQKRGLSKADNYQVNTLYKCPSTSSCLSAQGMESRVIHDKALQASTSISRSYYPGQARLHNVASSRGYGAWCARSDDQSPWIQIDLGKMIRVTGIATQGLMSYSSKPSYIVEYEVKYWAYQFWKPYRSTSKAYGLNTQRLPGNWDRNSVQYNALTPTFQARHVRVIPRSWNNYPCLRVEVYGCKV